MSSAVMMEIFWVTFPGVCGSFEPVTTTSSISYTSSAATGPAVIAADSSGRRKRVRFI